MAGKCCSPEAAPRLALFQLLHHRSEVRGTGREESRTEMRVGEEARGGGRVGASRRHSLLLPAPLASLCLLCLRHKVGS